MVAREVGLLRQISRSGADVLTTASRNLNSVELSVVRRGRIVAQCVLGPQFGGDPGENAVDFRSAAIDERIRQQEGLTAAVFGELFHHGHVDRTRTRRSRTSALPRAQSRINYCRRTSRCGSLRRKRERDVLGGVCVNRWRGAKSIDENFRAADAV